MTHAEPLVPRVGVPAAIAGDLTTAEQAQWISSFLRRHPVSRRSALRSGLVGAGALAVVSSPWSRVAGRAFAAPASFLVGRRVAFGADATKQVRFAGELTAALPAGARLVLDYGPTTAYGATADVDVRSLVTQLPSTGSTVVTGSQQFFAHATVDTLLPGTTFHWRFRYVDAGGTSATPDATVRTAPARGPVPAPFRFTALGDQGINEAAADAAGTARPNANTDAYAADDPAGVRRAAKPVDALVGLIAAEQGNAFHLHTGDMCYADNLGLGGPENPTTAAMQTFNPFTWTTYFGAIQPSAATVPWMFSTGNHDMEALYGTPQSGPSLAQAEHGYGGHAARLDFPGNGPAQCPSVYSFTYGNVACVALDANDLSAEIPSNQGYSGGSQLSWLTTRLTALRADPTVDFIVVYFHHCAYSTATTHGSDSGVRSALAPVLQAHGVDLVLQGHNHQYERSDPIRDGKSSRPAPDGSTVDPATDGPTYVLVGSGGRPHYDFASGDERYRGHTTGTSSTVAGSKLFVAAEASTDETVDWSQVRYARYAYLAVDVVPAAAGGSTTMTLRAVNDLGQEFDRLVLRRTAAAGAAGAPGAAAAAPPPASSAPAAAPTAAASPRPSAALRTPARSALRLPAPAGPLSTAGTSGTAGTAATAATGAPASLAATGGPGWTGVAGGGLAVAGAVTAAAARRRATSAADAAPSA